MTPQHKEAHAADLNERVKLVFLQAMDDLRPLLPPGRGTNNVLDKIVEAETWARFAIHSWAADEFSDEWCSGLGDGDS